MGFADSIEVIGKAVDVAGVVVVAGGILFVTASHFRRTRRTSPSAEFRGYRQAIGRVILLGLEFLVAADIIRTVAVSPSFHSAGVLAVIVAIRTFLSFTLELELEGRWPWQRRPTTGS